MALSPYSRFIFTNPPKKMPKEQKNKEEKKEKQGIDMSAEEVLDPDASGVVEFGGKIVQIKPMSAKTTLKVSKFIAKNLSKAWGADAFVRAKTDQTISEVEVWSGMLVEVLDNFDEKEIIELLSLITGETEEFMSENFSIASFMGVVRAFVETEDFEKIFLEVAKIAAAFRKTQ